MKRRILILLILFSGCDFKYPLYHDSDLIEVQGIEGVWKEQSSDKTVSVVKRNVNEYWLHFDSDSEETKEYTIARFLKLNGILFMNCEVGKTGETSSYLIAKVTLLNNTFSVVPMATDYLRELAQEKKIKLDVDTVRSGWAVQYLITEKTDRLQELVRKYCNDRNVFNDKDKGTYKKIR